MIGRTLLVVGLLLLGVWLLWSRWGPTRGRDLIGRRLLAAGITTLFVGAIVRLVARA